MSENDILFLSKALTFWDRLNSEEKELITKNLASIKYKKGEAIHRGENDCIGLFVVKSGTVRTYLMSEEGKEVTLYRLFERDVCVLSASCIIKNITFDVNIDAESECEILLINSSVFFELVQKNIYIENFSYKIAVDRFSDVIWAMEQILFMSFDKRLATFLIDEATNNNDDTISLTHEQIAKYMGSAREVVSRMLKYFANEGTVELLRGGVKILDKSKLRYLLK